MNKGYMKKTCVAIAISLVGAFVSVPAANAAPSVARSHCSTVTTTQWATTSPGVGWVKGVSRVLVPGVPEVVAVPGVIEWQYWTYNPATWTWGEPTYWKQEPYGPGRQNNGAGILPGVDGQGGRYVAGTGTVGHPAIPPVLEYSWSLSVTVCHKGKCHHHGWEKDGSHDGAATAKGAPHSRCDSARYLKSKEGK